MTEAELAQMEALLAELTDALDWALDACDIQNWTAAEIKEHNAKAALVVRSRIHLAAAPTAIARLLAEVRAAREDAGVLAEHYGGLLRTVETYSNDPGLVDFAKRQLAVYEAGAQEQPR